MKPDDVKPNSHINPSKEINYKNPKFKIGDIIRISKYKNIFAKGYVPNWSEEVVIKKLQKSVLWIYVTNDLYEEEIVGTFYEKELQKSNQNEFRVAKVIKRKGDNLYVKCKGCDNLLNSWIDKKDTVWMSKYFPEQKSLRQRVKVELDLSNYATKADLKNATSTDDTSQFLKKVDLANLKSEGDKLDIDKFKNVPTNLSNVKNKVDKLDVDKLVPVPVDLRKLSDVVKNDVAKKDVQNAKIKNIEDKISDITNLATNNTFNAKINEVKGKPSITNLGTTTALNAKINEVKNKIPNITKLATTTALTVVLLKIKYLMLVI